MNQERVGKKGYKRYQKRADDYLNDKEKAMDLLDTAKEKAQRRQGPLQDAWEKIQLFFNIFEDWIKGRYKVIPFKSIAMVTVGIIYFVMPLDLIPDFFLGFADDAAVLVFVFKQINSDLEDYKVWKAEQEQLEDENTVLVIDPEEEEAETKKRKKKNKS